MLKKTLYRRRPSVWAYAMILIALARWMRSGWSLDGFIDALAMLIVMLSMLGISRALLSEDSKC